MPRKSKKPRLASRRAAGRRLLIALNETQQALQLVAATPM